MEVIINEETNATKVNWNNIIIIPEFYDYLDLYTLKNISILSRLIRSKLKVKLFEYIQFNGENFEKYFSSGKNILWGSFVYRRYVSTMCKVTGFNDTPYKELEITPALNVLEDRLKELKPLVNIFELKYVYSTGYYLFSLFNMFRNLTTLKLNECTIPFIGLSDLSNSLAKLESVELNYVYFAKLPSEAYTFVDIKFPNTLKNLSIIKCNTISDTSLQNPYAYLLSASNEPILSDFEIMQVSMPSLLNLSFYSGFSDNNLNQFLSVNPQLEYLNLQSTCLDLFKLSYIENSKNLKNLEIECQMNLLEASNVPILKSIEELKFINVNEEFYPIIQKLCLSTPNLKKLDFEIGDVNNENSITNDLLENIIPKSNSLKYLGLYLCGFYSKPIDFSKLNKIECIRLQSNPITLLNIVFNNTTHLKRVQLEYYYNSGYAEDIVNKFTNIEGWKFINGTGIIKGYRI